MDQGTQRLIRRHNAQMRDLIVRDIDALEDKLNVKRRVSNLTEDAVESVKGKLGMNNGNPNESWMDFVRRNAAPLAAVGLGGAVLAKNLQSRSASTDTATVGSTHFDPTARPSHSDVSSDGMREQVGSAVSGVAEGASDGLDKVKETGQAVGDQVVQAKDMVIERIPSRGEARQMARDHGQILGVAALAAGAVAGTFVPRSQAEERHVAPLQTSMRDKASELADQGMDKAKETAERASEALSAGVDTVQEQLADTGDEEPPSSDVTQPNRITGSRLGATTTLGGGNGSY